jgi:hypothetical protein
MHDTISARQTSVSTGDEILIRQRRTQLDLSEPARYFKQVKVPEIYFRNSGLPHSLLRIQNGRTIPGHPRIGASWKALSSFFMQQWGYNGGLSFGSS